MAKVSMRGPQQGLHGMATCSTGGLLQERLAVHVPTACWEGGERTSPISSPGSLTQIGARSSPVRGAGCVASPRGATGIPEVSHWLASCVAWVTFTVLPTHRLRDQVPEDVGDTK